MNDALLPEELVKGLSGKKIGFDTKFKIRSINPKLTAAGLTQKREAFARFANYITDEEEDAPKINPRTVNPQAIADELLSKPYRVPQPRYNDETLPEDTIKYMFAENFTGSSGNANTDNQMVDYVAQTQRAERESDIDDQLRDQEADQAAEPLDLENVVEAVQAPAPQVNPQAFGSLFPQDTLGQAIANRGNRRG